MATCPICDSVEYTESFTLLESTVAEEFNHCPRCGYQYDFAYGAWRECIDGKVFETDAYLVARKARQEARAARHLGEKNESAR